MSIANLMKLNISARTHTYTFKVKVSFLIFIISSYLIMAFILNVQTLTLTATISSHCLSQYISRSPPIPDPIMNTSAVIDTALPRWAGIWRRMWLRCGRARWMRFGQRLRCGRRLAASWTRRPISVRCSRTRAAFQSVRAATIWNIVRTEPSWRKKACWTATGWCRCGSRWECWWPFCWWCCWCAAPGPQSRNRWQSRGRPELRWRRCPQYVTAALSLSLPLSLCTFLYFSPFHHFAIFEKVDGVRPCCHALEALVVQKTVSSDSAKIGNA